MGIKINRKVKKFICDPGLFIRDALINKYPLVLNQCNIQSSTENTIFNAEHNVNAPFSPDFNIDIVYTWVSISDRNWLIKKNKHISNVDAFELYATEDSRYTDHNEIYYSVMSVCKHLSWVNNIYIITDEQVPELPVHLMSRIKIIDHKEIIPEIFLPTFNSHVIEAFLHKIPGLSENFIYFNDDFFVAREIDASHFFRSNGHASLFASSKSIMAMNRNGRRTATLSACNNVNELFDRNYSVKYDKALTHIYVPLKKNIIISPLNYLVITYTLSPEINSGRQTI